MRAFDERSFKVTILGRCLILLILFLTDQMSASQRAFSAQADEGCNPLLTSSPSPAAASYLSLLQYAQTKLSTQEMHTLLKKLASSEKALNPIQKATTSVETQIQAAFNKILKSLKPQDWLLIQENAKSLLAHLEKETQIKIQKKSETAFVYEPKAVLHQQNQSLRTKPHFGIVNGQHFMLTLNSDRISIFIWHESAWSHFQTIEAPHHTGDSFNNNRYFKVYQDADRLLIVYIGESVGSQKKDRRMSVLALDSRGLELVDTIELPNLNSTLSSTDKKLFFEQVEDKKILYLKNEDHLEAYRIENKKIIFDEEMSIELKVEGYLEVDFARLHDKTFVFYHSNNKKLNAIEVSAKGDHFHFDLPLTESIDELAISYAQDRIFLGLTFKEFSQSIETQVELLEFDLSNKSFQSILHKKKQKLLANPPFVKELGNEIFLFLTNSGTNQELNIYKIAGQKAKFQAKAHLPSGLSLYQAEPRWAEFDGHYFFSFFSSTNKFVVSFNGMSFKNLATGHSSLPVAPHFMTETIENQTTLYAAFDGNGIETHKIFIRTELKE